MRLFQLLSLMILCVSVVVEAKDLSKRLGVGYRNPFNMDLPAITSQYYPNPDMGFGASLGLDTQKDASKFGFMITIDRNIFQEDNMNFFMGVGLGLVSEEKIDDKNESGFELKGYAGTEFFLPGLENLGIRFEAGVGVTSKNSGVRFRTIGDSPIRAGMIFYF